MRRGMKKKVPGRGNGTGKPKNKTLGGLALPHRLGVSFIIRLPIIITAVNTLVRLKILSYYKSLFLHTTSARALSNEKRVVVIFIDAWLSRRRRRRRFCACVVRAERQ